MKKTVDIKDSTAKRIRVEAAKRGISFKRLVEVIIEDNSKYEDIKQIKTQHNEV